ncbi:MAG TPA: heme-binding domain-containing protein [Chlorobaculum sp.]|nr:heme-binding domain-containing protein [Chlorobaculum sp.]
MSKRNRIAAGWIVIALILCQFVPLNRSNPVSGTPDGFPAEIRTVLVAHCYRCHSYETKWPVSAYIAPLSWIVVREVHKAREALNFSNLRKQPTADGDTARFGIHKIADSKNISRHATIVGFPQIRMTEKERRLLLDWSSGQQL